MNKTTRSDIYRIDPRSIVVKNDFNSRVDFGDIEELAKQIAKDGVLNPLHVQRIKDNDGNEKFQLVDGERRYRAIQYSMEHGIEMPNVPVLLVNKDMPEQDLIRIQIQCNEGKNFTEYEYGVAYKKLNDLGMTNAQIAEFVGKPQWHVSACMAHLKRDEKVQELLNEGKITGVDVRHVYQANANNEDSVSDILNLEKKRQEKEAEALAEQEQLKQRLKGLEADDTSNNKKEIRDIKAKQKEVEKKVKNASRITITDLDIDSNTIQAKDSLIIKQGLLALRKYLDPQKQGNKMSNINVDELLARLQSGEYINTIANDCQKTA